MSVLLDRESRILLHGIADPLGHYQCYEMLRYGTSLVGIVEPHPDSLDVEVPPELAVYRSVAEAIAATGANFSVVYSSPFDVLGAVSEAAEAGIGTVVCMTEGVPVHDALVLRHRTRHANTVLVGPNSSGVYSPVYGKAGYFCRDICLPGRIGVVGKSGSLAYAVMCELKSLGIGISTVVTIGGDMVRGIGYCEVLARFQADTETDAIVLLGEIGGDDEEQAAAYIGANLTKPVVAFISGRSVPAGQNMGHAGAIAEKGRGDYSSKVEALAAEGITVAGNIGEVATIVRSWQREGEPPA